jgi:hypothetical protein
MKPMRLSTKISLLFGTCALLVLGLFGTMHTATAQGYINQTVVEDMLNHRAESLDDIPEVYYEYYIMNSSSGNNVLARNTFLKILGNGDLELGKANAQMVVMLNRTVMQNVNIGDTLIIPNQYGLDFRAYSPFPRYYTGGREFDKLFIMDKSIQAFAAYEYGQLVRWGIINTGNPDESPTPNGRYNFNWRADYRVSSLSPAGEEWEMYWVMNFHQARGMHVHQYEMPTGGPMSHGCVRLVDADAQFVYNWADTWETSVAGDGLASSTGRIKKQGTTVLVLGTEPKVKPQPFEFRKNFPILKRVELPAHPYDIPPGTPQQEYFDKLRASAAEGTN